MSSDIPDDGEHIERLTDPDQQVRWLGELEGMAVAEYDDGPVLFLHGEERSCAVQVTDTKFVDGLTRAAVEIEAIDDV